MRVLRHSFTVLVVLGLGVGCLDLDDGHYRFPCDGCSADGGSGGGTGGRDGGTRDGGAQSSCADTCTVPAAFCSDSKTLVTPRLRACTGTACQFENSTFICTQSCTAGACVNEPCAGVVCNAAPAATCLSPTTLRVFVTPGSCNGGLCGYSSGDVTCSGGCSNGVCAGNPCAGKSCTLPPAATCMGNVLRTYASLGVCDGATGGCTYDRVDTVCAAGCANAMCTADPCSGVTCNTPPAPSCLSTTTRQFFATAGVCSSGNCSYSAMTETCTAGKTCQGGQCVTVQASCTTANCASGCCSGTACIPYSGQSTSSCGTAANMCLACSSGYTCTTGACTDINECAVNNGGCNSHADCTNTPGSRTCACKAGYFGDGITCQLVADGGTPAWVKVRDGGTDADPAARRGAGMAFDSATGETVMFGGYDGVSALNDTWVWQGTKWSVVASATSPVARRLPSMAYDSARSVVVMFGGFDGTQTLNDTWEWNGATWRRISTNTSPGARYGAGMAYDSKRGVVVMFGGQTSSGSGELGDTWEFDGTDWKLRTIAVSPTVRFGPAMAFDSIRGVTVLFGGSAASMLASDTWEWNGSSWSPRITSGPSGRYGAVGAFLAGRFIVFGGNTTSSTLSDTWEWNGTWWSQRTTPVSPGNRYYPQGAADVLRGKLVLFGGRSDLSGPYLNDTWEYGP